MALVQPGFVTAERGQDMTETITIPTDTTGWTMTAILREYAGGPALATKTVGSGIVNTPGGSSSVAVITWSATDLTQPPGMYLRELQRTNAGAVYPAIDPSGFLIFTNSAGSYPTMTNLAEYYAALQYSETVTDANAKQHLILLASAENRIRTYCGRQLTYGTYTEYIPANWQTFIQVKEKPLQSITSIYFDLAAMGGQSPDAFPSTSLLTSGVDYWYDRDRQTDTYSDSGKIYRANGYWQGAAIRKPTLLGYNLIDNPGVIKVTYVAGYNLVPIELKQAVWDITTLARFAIRSGRLPTSESGEGHSVSFGGIDEEIRRIGSVQAVLAAYKRGDTYVA